MLSVSTLVPQKKVTMIWHQDVKMQKEVGIYKAIMDTAGGGESEGNFERAVFQVNGH